MAHIILRTVFGESNADDLTLNVQDRTFEHLMTTISPEIRISAFLEADTEVADEYAEVFVSDDCAYDTLVTKVIPGSRTRKDIALPGEMKLGEQLTILVDRRPKGSA